MSGHDTGGGGHSHLEGGVPVLETQLERIEREQKEAKNRDRLYKDEQLQINRQQLKVNTLLMIFTCFLVVTSAITSFISLYQAKIAKISAIAARDAVAVASGTLDEAEKSEARQAESNRLSLKSAIDNFHLDQRAWVGVDNIVGAPAKGQSFVIQVYVKNTGKTPAMNVEPWKRVEALARMPHVQPNCRRGLASGPTKSNGFLNPGGTFLLVLNPSHGLPLQQELKDILGAKKSLYVYGCLIYDDVFRSPHWLTYCSSWDEKSNSYAPCEKYNDSGDGPLAK
jgi:hypothetical protein